MQHSGFMISLAHFCELHGPTSILCTQLSPLSCHTCQPLSTPPSECFSKNSSFSSGFFEPSSPISSAGHSYLSPSASPPTSPRPTAGTPNPYFSQSGYASDQSAATAGLRRRCSSSEQEFDACDNCSFLVPEGVSKQIPAGAPGSPAKNGRGRNGSPVLRTTQAVLAHGQATPPPERGATPASSQPSPDNSYKAREGFAMADRGSRRQKSMMTAELSSSAGSGYSTPINIPRNTHAHNLTFVTQRQPSSPTSYSLLRRACIRTLSCENLPRGSPSGPLTFGDSVAGYTVAYVFRLPDPRARGRRRTYALLCLGPKDSFRVTAVMVQVLKAFENIAASIISMATRVLEVEAGAPGILCPDATFSVNSFGSPLHSSRATSAASDRIEGPESHALPGREAAPLDPRPSAASKSSQPTIPRSTGSPDSQLSNTKPLGLTDVSSFLSAKKVDPDGYPRVSREVMRAKGLAEITGREDFFVELHARFCVILKGLLGF